jgi:hypothetical protein
MLDDGSVPRFAIEGLRFNLQAFFDDSESFRGGGLVILAGYVAADDQWNAFAVEWARVLQRHGLLWLHTSDFLNQDGDHKGMNLIPSARIEVLRDLMMIVRKHIQCGVAVAVDPVGFRELMNAVPKHARLGKAVDFCLLRVLRLCMEHVKDYDVDHPMVVNFDDSHEDSARFYHAFRRLRRTHNDLLQQTAGIAFLDDRIITPLQAADLLACISGREYAKGERAWGVDSPFRDLLLDPDPAYGLLYRSELWDRDALAKLIQSPQDSVAS